MDHTRIRPTRPIMASSDKDMVKAGSWRGLGGSDCLKVNTRCPRTSGFSSSSQMQALTMAESDQNLFRQLDFGQVGKGMIGPVCSGPVASPTSAATGPLSWLRLPMQARIPLKGLARRI